MDASRTLAPLAVEFYASDWTEIGTKSELYKELLEITGINIRVLKGMDPYRYNVAERMSWAAVRNTTRVEDMAYCLLGIFRVNMLLLYGEGETSFIRLQEEIMKASEDQTLFAWPIPGSLSEFSDSERRTLHRGMLASSVRAFCVGNGFDRKYSDLDLFDPSRLLARGQSSLFDASTVLNTPPVLTGRGLRLHIPLLKHRSDGTYSALLNCIMLPERSLVFISLIQLGTVHGSIMEKVPSVNWGFHLVPAEKLRDFKTTTVYVRQGHQTGHYRHLKSEL